MYPNHICEGYLLTSMFFQISDITEACDIVNFHITRRLFEWLQTNIELFCDTGSCLNFKLLSLCKYLFKKFIT